MWQWGKSDKLQIPINNKELERQRHITKMYTIFWYKEAMTKLKCKKWMARQVDLMDSTFWMCKRICIQNTERKTRNQENLSLSCSRKHDSSANNNCRHQHKHHINISNNYRFVTKNFVNSNYNSHRSCKKLKGLPLFSLFISLICNLI